MQKLEGAGHLFAAVITGPVGDLVEVADLAFIDEEAEFAGLGKIGLRGQQGQRFVGWRLRRGGDGQQGAAQAIPCGMDLRGAAVQGDDGAQRIEDTQAQIVVERQVAVARVGVAPGQHINRVPLPHQIVDERVVRLQIEDVVLHDPRRHDQQRLGVHLGGLRRVADQFDQVVPEYHFALRDGQVAADFKARRFGELRRVGRARDIGEPIHRALGQVRAPGLRGVLLHDRIGGEPVGRRQHAQPLAGKKLRHLDVMRRHARHVRGFAPERLAVAKAAAQDIEGPGGPGRVAKARVVVAAAHRGLAAGAVVGGRVLQRIAPELRGQCRQFHLPPWRYREVPGPIGPGQ